MKDIVRRFHMHPKSKTSVEKLIKRKYTFSSQSNLRPANIFPKKLDSLVSLSILLICPYVSHFCPSFNHQKTSKHYKTPHNDVLSLLGKIMSSIYGIVLELRVLFGMNKLCQGIDRE